MRLGKTKATEWLGDLMRGHLPCVTILSTFITDTTSEFWGRPRKYFFREGEEELGVVRPDFFSDVIQFWPLERYTY